MAMPTPTVVYLLLVVLTCSSILLRAAQPMDISDQRVVLRMNRVNRGGCPYTASFLCTAKHFALHMKYGVKWQKMEAANWNAISSHRNKFQLHNISAFYVNHMSAYEHATRKKFGFTKSEESTLQFSSGAVQGECRGVERELGHERGVLALVPFFGGRPPNVTADLRVTSLGQGNSLVKGEIKALQTLAVVCSLLRHFSSVVVGVTRPQDHKYITDTLGGIDGSTVAARVRVLLLRTHKPANLPFVLLEWGRAFVREVNDCEREPGPGGLADKQQKKTKNSKIMHELLSPDINNNVFMSSEGSINSSTAADSKQCNALFPSVSGLPISHVYYTESDQILHFSDVATRRAIMSATNASTLVIGRRMEKVVDSAHPPATYTELLAPTRALCGDSSQPYELDWPASPYIQSVHTSRSA